MAGTYENVTRNSPTFRMTVDDKDKIDAFTLVDFRLVVGRCHGSPFCVHLLQEKKYFYRDNTEIILNYEEVKSLVDAYSGLNAVKDRIGNDKYTGKYSFVNWHLKNGWSFGEKLKVHVKYRKVFRRVTLVKLVDGLNERKDARIVIDGDLLASENQLGVICPLLRTDYELVFVKRGTVPVRVVLLRGRQVQQVFVHVTVDESVDVWSQGLFLAASCQPLLAGIHFDRLDEKIEPVGLDVNFGSVSGRNSFCFVNYVGRPVNFGGWLLSHELPFNFETKHGRHEQGFCGRDFKV